jgi:hypothetical protein
MPIVLVYLHILKQRKMKQAFGTGGIVMGAETALAVAVQSFAHATQGRMGRWETANFLLLKGGC